VQVVLDAGLLAEAEIEALRQDALGAIESARVFAEAAPEPSVETIEEGVYAP
jgi:TPP-dependent pyruvate/acetoin dehydrogenase alpha subunit